ncbi:MAG: SRPBCC domain-containing protein [Chloroflexia bacterium]|nr:SRPBCC domain-containing protein [Chloroflexia bacterium]
MPESRDGWLIFEPVFDSIVVRFDRTLPHPPKPVWERLIDRAHLHEWLTSEPGGHIRHRKDGDVYLPTIGGAVIESDIDEFIPERTLAFGWVTFDWDGGEVSWDLEPVDGGTLVHFEHSDDDLGPDHFARLLANWHMTHDLFEASLAGSPRSWNWEAWQAYYLHYGRKLVHLLDSFG